ncbi:hypothetical protein AB2B41_19630 [Marimonas sp. MJW-29]|uniref:DUF600 family protein n=1 Tax=Sulfitobacter sediminis TaxID=3234186 RepID=A0ABV3RSE3_9RHOB
MATRTQSELAFAVGELIVEDPGIAGKEWEAISVVATFRDGAEELVGYRYESDGGFEALEPVNADDILDKLEELRDAMDEEVEGAWVQCLIHIAKPDFSFRVQYEYSDPDRWSPDGITNTMAEFAESLKPD